MTKSSVVLIISCALMLYGCTNPESKSGWAETTGTITGFEMDDGSYAYTLLYDADQSIALDPDGNPIKGPISKIYFQQTKRAVSGQKVKMRYNIEEPTFHEILESVDFIE